MKTPLQLPRGGETAAEVPPRGDLEGVAIPCCYLAPVSHYSAYYRADEVWLEVCDHFVKQTLRNRCYIDSPNGALALTIPVVKPEGKTLMKDIRISDHGNWRHQHWVALESSYRQSPFFEYYADDFAPFYEKKWEFLADFNEELMMLVTSLLDIQKPIKRTTSYSPTKFSGPTPIPSLVGRGAVTTPDSFISGRTICSPPYKGGVGGESGGSGAVYYQVFASRHGFLPDLSIVDLLFNQGPEGVLWL
ncbi:MAG: WbqC family protein [Bacteroidaceae bacterium]|nr:WbqC family protein [Bacteroidaceae bacterium]